MVINMRKKQLIACIAACCVLGAAVMTGCSQGSSNDKAPQKTSAQTEAAAKEEAEEDKSEEAENGGEKAEEKTAGTEGSTRTIIDHNGNEVVLPAEINRVVISGILPLPSVFCQFRGSAKEIVGIHPSSMAAAENSYLVKVYPEILDADTSFVENGSINIEQLLTLDPDVVFYSAANSEERELFAKAGIPCVGFSTTIADYDCVETYAQWIALFGEIYGEQETANEIIEDGRRTAEEISAITETIPSEERPNVLIIFNYANGAMTTAGSHFFSEYWLDKAGANNVAAELTGTAEINMEQVYEWDPDIILITNFSPYLPEDLLNNTIDGYDWSGVSAVKNGQVYKFPLGMYRWFPPASDTPLVLMWLAKTIQPERFADLDLDARIKNFYQTHYHVALSDEELETIYHPAREASGVKQ